MFVKKGKKKHRFNSTGRKRSRLRLHLAGLMSDLSQTRRKRLLLLELSVSLNVFKILILGIFKYSLDIFNIKCSNNKGNVHLRF